MLLSSPAIQSSGAAIPARYTSDGANVSPPLSWTDVPDGTRSLALVVDDPDAPDPRAPRRTWVHWVVYNLPPDVGALPEAAAAVGLPAGAREGLNDWEAIGYGGPAPPIGRHRYFHKLYALDIELPRGGVLDKAEVERAMKGHILAQAELIGTYQRGGK